MVRRIAGALACWVLAAFLPFTVCADQANTYQINPAHNGAISTGNMPAALTASWSVTLGGVISAPILADGKIFVTVYAFNATSNSYAAEVYALNPVTGNTIWGPVVAPGGNSSAYASYDNGRLFVANEGGTLTALDAATGLTLWSQALESFDSFTASPTPYNGTVYAQGFETLYALDEVSGDVQWKASVGYPNDTTPAVTATGVYVNSSGTTVAYNPTSGAIIWSGENPNTYYPTGYTPVVAGGRVYDRSSSSIAIYDAAAGTFLGSFSASTPPVLSGNQMFFVDAGVSAIALEATDPLGVTVDWSFTGDGHLSAGSPPLYLNGHIYIGSTGGNLYAVNAFSGAQEWTVSEPTYTNSTYGTASGFTVLAAAEGVLAAPIGPTLYAFSYTATPSPIIDAVSVGVFTGTTATITASINPNGSDTMASISYGLDTTYGSQTPTVDLGSGSTDAALDAAITGLSPGVTYHYQVTVTNSAGTTSSLDGTFTTASELSPTVTTGLPSSDSATGANLTASVNPNGLDTMVYFQYGTSTAYGSQTTSVDAGSGGVATTIASAITGLSPNTTYHYCAVAQNSTGTSTGADQIFLTPPLILPTISSVTSSVTGLTTATLSGYIDADGLPASASFEYGLDTTYGTTAAVTAIASTATSYYLSAQLSNLTPGQTYHFSLVATNANGSANSVDQTFVTPSALATISSISATPSANGATIGFTLDQSSYFGDQAITYSVEYGLDAAYGSTSPSETVEIYYEYGYPESAVVTGLAGGTTYHYSIAATNSYGTSYSPDATFTTYNASQEPLATTGAASAVNSYSATLLGAVNPNGLDTSFYFEYGLDKTYGNTGYGYDVGSGTTSVAVSSTIDYLNAGTTYHYRLDATSAAGTTYGADQTFTTATGSGGGGIGTLTAANISAYVTPRHFIDIDVFGAALSYDPASLAIFSVSQGSVGSVGVDQDGTLVYTPGPGFKGLDAFDYTLTDSSGYTSSAVVTIRNLQTSAAGIYSGLISDANGDFTATGLLSIALTPTGAFTGKLLVAGDAFPLRGSLTPDGNYASEFRDHQRNTIGLNFQVAPATGSLSGEATYSGVAGTVNANRNPYNAIGNPAPQAGNYTLILPPGGETAQGYGYALMHVTIGGAVSMTGRRGDGVAFSTKASLDPTGTFPFYAASAPATQACLAGSMTFETTSMSDCDGTINWYLGTPLSTYAGETAQLAAVASRYIEPGRGIPVLQSTDTTVPTGNFVASLSEADQYGDEIDWTVTLTSHNVFVAGPGNQISMKINLANGYFSGAFVDPNSNKSTPYNGVIFQRQNTGFGLYSTAKETTYAFSIAPTTPAAILTLHNGSLSFKGGVERGAR